MEHGTRYPSHRRGRNEQPSNTSRYRCQTRGSLVIHDSPSRECEFFLNPFLLSIYFLYRLSYTGSRQVRSLSQRTRAWTGWWPIAGHGRTHSHTTSNSEMAVSLQRVSLNWGRKPPRHGEKIRKLRDGIRTTSPEVQGK